MTDQIKPHRKTLTAQPEEMISGLVSAQAKTSALFATILISNGLVQKETLISYLEMCLMADGVTEVERFLFEDLLRIVVGPIPPDLSKLM